MDEVRKVFSFVFLTVMCAIAVQLFLDVRTMYTTRIDLKTICDNASELNMNRFQSVDLSTSLEEKNKYINSSGAIKDNYAEYLSKLNSSIYIPDYVIEYLSNTDNINKGMLPIDLGLPYLDIEYIEPLIKQDIINLSDYNKKELASGIEIKEVTVTPSEKSMSISPMTESYKSLFWGSDAISYQENDTYEDDFIITFNFSVKIDYEYTFRTSIIYGLKVPLDLTSEYQYTLVY